MAARVIQGFFHGGLPRPLPGVPAAPAIQRRAIVPAASAPARPGPPSPAFAGRAVAAQRQGGKGDFAVDPVQLGLVRNGGKPLPAPLLAKMEAAFGADFSAVRIHVGTQAARIGAVAFTTGNDLYFAPGRYQPDSVQGQQLIGHELAHVIQQRQGRVRAQGNGISVVQDHALEAEADRLGVRAAMHRAPVQAKMARHFNPASRQPIQRAAMSIKERAALARANRVHKTILELDWGQAITGSAVADASLDSGGATYQIHYFLDPGQGKHDAAYVAANFGDARIKSGGAQVPEGHDYSQSITDVVKPLLVGKLATLLGKAQGAAYDFCVQKTKQGDGLYYEISARWETIAAVNHIVVYYHCYPDKAKS